MYKGNVMPPIKKKLNLSTEELVSSIEEQSGITPTQHTAKAKVSAPAKKKELTISHTRRMTEKQIKEYMKTL